MARETIPHTGTISKYRNISMEDYQRYLSMYGKWNRNTNSYDSSEDLDRWFSWYDSYLEKIAPYKGTEYYQQLLNNPYASFQQWKGDPWQSLGNAMTGSGANTFYNDRENNAMEEFSRILGLIQENQYNSPVSQVQRDRAAGINDTLSGSIAGDTPAAGNAPDETPPAPGPEGMDFSGFAQDVVGLATGFIHGCVSLQKAFNEIGLQDAAKAAAEGDLVEQVNRTALEEEAAALPAPTKGPDGTYDFSAALDGLSLGASKVSAKRNPPYKNQRMRQLYNRARGTILYDEEGRPTVALQRAYKKLYADSAEDAVRGARAMSHPGFDMNDPLGFSAKIAEVETNITNQIHALELDLKGLQKRISSAGAASAEARASYDQGYYSPELGTAAAADAMDEFDTAKSEREVRRATAKFKKGLEDSRNQLMSLCGSNPYAKILLPGLLNTVDGIGNRVLDHVDGFLDMIINPVGKVLGKGAAGLFQSKPAPAPTTPIP